MTPAAQQLLATLRERRSQQVDELDSDVGGDGRVSATARRDLYGSLITELEAVIPTIEGQAFFGEEYQDFFGQDAA